jgi:hypothetical protein
MKKLIFKTFIIITLIGITAACNKDFESKPAPEESLPGETNLKTNNTEDLIVAFIDEVNNSYKSSGEYTVDSALWYIEAALNYSYCIWDSSFGVQAFDSATISVSLKKNGSIEDTDVYSTYNDFVDSLEVHWDNISETTKHVMFVDVAVRSNTNGVVVLHLVSAMGSGAAVNSYANFGADEDWYWGWDLGGCGNNTATSSDATIELEYKYLNPIVNTVPAYRVYFTGVEIIEYVYPTDYPYSSAPREHRVFIYVQEDYPITSEPCLDNLELNFYLGSNGYDYIVDDKLPTGFDFTGLDIREDIVPGAPSYYGRQHVLDIYYGEIDYTTTSPSTL